MFSLCRPFWSTDGFRHAVPECLSVHTAKEYGTCQSTLRTNYGKLLRTNELCATLNAGNSDLSKNSSSYSNEKSVCVSDCSGSPLVCDGVLTGVLVDRTKCEPGAVYTFAYITQDALRWRSGDERTAEPIGPFDHFVLIFLIPHFQHEVVFIPELPEWETFWRHLMCFRPCCFNLLLREPQL